MISTVNLIKTNSKTQQPYAQYVIFFFLPESPINLFMLILRTDSVENYDKIHLSWWISLFSSPVCWTMYVHRNEKFNVDYYFSLLLVV